MKPECAQAIQTAAGRKLTKNEYGAIEDRVHSSLRELAVTDRAGFHGMSTQERMVAAASLAKEKMIQDVVRAQESTIREAGKSAARASEMAAIVPGRNGQVKYLRNKIANIGNSTYATASTFFSLVRGLEDKDGGKLFGMIQDPAQQIDLARAMFGEQASPEAMKVAESVRGMNSAIVKRMNSEGLPIHEREDYVMPQPQDPTLVAKAGREAWIKDTMPRLDRSKYVAPDGTMMNDDAVRHLLEESYRSIATDGANHRAEGGGHGGGSMVGANKNAPRQLFFKDSESWMSQMKDYGVSTNMYELEAHHVLGLSKNIEMAKAFGRDADTNLRQMLAKAYEADQNASGPKDVRPLAALQSGVQRLYDATAHPDRAGNEARANVGAQIRGLMGSTQLGSLVGALPDLAGMKMAAEYNGLPFARMLREFADAIIPGKEKEDFFNRLGIWQEGFQHASNRMGIDEVRNGWGNFLNEATHRLMGLNAFDRGLRVANGRVVLDVLGKLTRRMDLSEADGETRLLGDHGVTEDHWNVWKAAEVDKGRGNENLLTLDGIRNIPDAKMDPLAEQRVAKRSQVFQDAIDQRNDATAREQTWVDSRIQKFQDMVQRTSKALADLNKRRGGKADALDEAMAIKTEELQARIDGLQARHDISLNLRTEMTQGRMKAFLDAVEGGRSAEAAGKWADRSIGKFGTAADELGANLGRKIAQSEAKIKAAEQKASDYRAGQETDMQGRQDALNEKYKGVVDDIKAYSDQMEEHAQRRQDYIDAFQAKMGDVIAEERANMKNEAMEKLMEVTHAQMHFGARGASRSTVADQLAMGSDPKTAGTFAGEIWRFVTQFKGVPLGIFREHWNAMQGLDGVGSKMAYGAKFVGYSALMGALATEAKAIINGQNPRDMNITTPEGKKFWMESMAAGGGMGLYGDLFANGRTKLGSGAEVLAGPGISAGFNILKELSQAREEAMSEGDSKHNYGLAALRIVRQNAVPFANVWYAKAAFNRLVYDQLQDQLSPGHSAKQQQQMQAKGLSYWWAPGTTSPQSAPDLSQGFQSR